MGLFLPQRWRRQPQGLLELDRGNPLTRGLRACLVPGQVIDLGSRARVTLSNPAYRATMSGIALSSGSMQSLFPRGTTDLTLALLCDVASLDPSGSITIGKGSLPAGGDLLVASAGSDGSVSAQTAVSSGSSTAVTDAGVMQAGRAGLLVARLAETTIDVSYGRARSTVTVSRAFIGTARVLFFSGNSNVRVALGALWERPIAGAEAESLHENPWQLMRPLRPIIYSLPTSGPVLSNTTVTEIGATSARVRTTITYPA